jgi:flagellar biosynthetic protein FliR
MSLLDHIPAALLVIFRIGGLMVFAPVLGSSIVPGRLKVLLAFVIGAAAYPVLASQHEFGAGLALNLWTLGPLVALEVLIGVAIGFLASLPLTAMQAGGVIIGQQMGLGFAQLYNPAIDDESDVVAQVLYFLALAAFLAIGGLDSVVLALLHTFERVPAGAAGGALGIELVTLSAGLLISALELGMRVAAPLMCIVFLETVALGFLSKTVPQLNVLSLGFPIRILVGLVILALGVAVINDVVLDEINAGFEFISDWTAGGEGPSAVEIASSDR